MFALKFTYLAFLGLWLGCLVTIRYILPAVLSLHTSSNAQARAAVLSAVARGNRMGFACSIAMGGSLFLQSLLAGDLIIDARYILLLFVIFTMLGATEILSQKYRNAGEPVNPAIQPEGEHSIPGGKKLIPGGLRIVLFVQIILSLYLFGISVS